MIKDPDVRSLTAGRTAVFVFNLLCSPWRFINITRTGTVTICRGIVRRSDVTFADESSTWAYRAAT